MAQHVKLDPFKVITDIHFPQKHKPQKATITLDANYGTANGASASWTLTPSYNIDPSLYVDPPKDKSFDVKITTPQKIIEQDQKGGDGIIRGKVKTLHEVREVTFTETFAIRIIVSTGSGTFGVLPGLPILPDGTSDYVYAIASIRIVNDKGIDLGTIGSMQTVSGDIHFTTTGKGGPLLPNPTPILAYLPILKPPPPGA